MDIGAKIAQLRKKRNMTQGSLAEQLGITDKAVSKWERGLSSPDISLLATLASALGVTVDELLLGKENAPESFLSVEKYFMGSYGYVVFDRLPDEAKVVLLMDSPDLDEVSHGYPLSGRAGEVLSAYLFGERAAPTPGQLSEKGIGVVYVSNVPLLNLEESVAPLVSELEFIRLNRDYIDRFLADRFVAKMAALIAREDVDVIAVTRWFNQKYFAYFLSRATPEQLSALHDRIAKGNLRILYVGVPSLWNSEKEKRRAEPLKAYFNS